MEKEKLKLGFGVMRMPVLDENDSTSFDYKTCNAMVDAFIVAGFSHFDTAYVYHNGKSEDMIKKCLTSRYPRGKYTLSTKLPIPLVKTEKDNERLFSEQLKNCGVEYFDYYLLHALNEEKYKDCVKYKCFEFGVKKKKEGEIKKFGFSFHDEAKLLEKILAQHSEVDFVLLQINYLDWDDKSVQSRLCYETALKYGKEILVMEPLKGGNLAVVPKEAEALMKKARPDMSVPSWAIRFAAGLPGVTMVLSGMSSLKQVNDNTSYMKHFEPLSDKEQKVIAKVKDIISGNTEIKCTGCNYCVDGCPQKIAIPQWFALYNDFKRSKGEGWSSQFAYYDNLSKSRGKASACIECGLCEQSCPQKLTIIKNLVSVRGVFEGDAFWPSGRKPKKPR